MEFFLRAEVVVFTGVLVVVALVAVLEVGATAMAGVGFSHLVEALVDTDSLPDSTFTNWLLIKDVPLMIALMTASSGFGITGLALQGLSLQVLGAAQPAWAAYTGAVAGAMGAMRLLNGAFKRLKVVHTTAVHPDEFIGRVAVVLSEGATRERPGEAKFTDQHGQTHYLMVRPIDQTSEFKQGDSVVLRAAHGAFYDVERA